MSWNQGRIAVDWGRSMKTRGRQALVIKPHHNKVRRDVKHNELAIKTESCFFKVIQTRTTRNSWLDEILWKSGVREREELLTKIHWLQSKLTKENAQLQWLHAEEWTSKVIETFKLAVEEWTRVSGKDRVEIPIRHGEEEWNEMIDQRGKYEVNEN